MPLFQRKPQEIEAFRYGFDTEPDWFRALKDQGVIVIREASNGRSVARIQGLGDLYDGMWLVRQPRRIVSVEDFNDTFEPKGDEPEAVDDTQLRQVALDMAIKATGQTADLESYTVKAAGFLAFLKGLAPST